MTTMAEYSDKEIEYAMKYYENEINRFIFHQFTMHMWKQNSNIYQLNKYKDHCNSHKEFAKNMVDNVDQNKMKILLSKEYFRLISNDILIYILSFLCHDDKLIHTTLIVLNTHFNSIIKNNYHSFHYKPNFRSWYLRINQNINETMDIDFRLDDGFWISNVSMTCIEKSANNMLKLSFGGLPNIRLHNQLQTTGMSITTRNCDTNQNHVTKFVSSGMTSNTIAVRNSMTQRPCIIHNHQDGLKSLISGDSFSGTVDIKNNVFKLPNSACVDVRHSDTANLYHTNDKHEPIPYQPRIGPDAKYSSWHCGMIDKCQTITTNGQVKVLFDIRNCEQFVNMTDKKYYEAIVTRYNFCPLSIDKKTVKTPYNTLNQAYMFEYWVHIDNHDEIAPFGTKSSIQDQNKMYQLFYSQSNCQIDNHSDEYSGVNVIQSYEQFESLYYNGKYISDSLSINKISCINNDLILITPKKRLYHKYSSNIGANELIKQLGFISQRPILVFDLNTLFNHEFYCNEKQNWKLMLLIKPKYMFVKFESKWVHLFGKNHTKWQNGELLFDDNAYDNDKYFENKNNCKAVLLKTLHKWKGQCKVRIDITKEIVSKLNPSIEQIHWLATEMKEVTLIESNTDNSCDMIFYDYFVHLDDQYQVKSLPS